MPDVQRIPVVRGERPRRRGNRKLLAFLFLFFIALMLVLFFQSSFSKIHQIYVEGNRLLTTEQIIQASGVTVGDHFFGVNTRKVGEKIMNLGVTEEVRTSKTFPGVVSIAVKEFPVVALELTEEGNIAGLLSNGQTVPYGIEERAASRPILTGWGNNPLKANLARTLSAIPPELLQDVSEIVPSPTGSYPDRIILYTRSQFEVITSISYLPEKISLLDDYVYGMQNGDRTTGRIILLESNHAEPLEEPEGANEGE